MTAPMRLGFGVSGPLGEAWFSEEKAASLIGAAYAAGVREFDTAPFYGAAASRLGRALRAVGADDAIVSTKTGTRREGGRLIKDFSEAAIRRDVEMSLTALDRSALDLLYLHGPSPEQTDAARPVLEKLKGEGVVKSIGVCGDGASLVRGIETGFDAVMCLYNIIEQKNGALFIDARARGLKTVAIGALADGLLDPAFAAPRSLSDIWRLARAAYRPRYEKNAIAAARAALGDEDPAGRALSFVLANPAVDLVMTTTTKNRHLNASLAVSRNAPDHGELIAAPLTANAAAPS